MKKKFLSLMLVICMIIPCAFMLNACGEKDNSLDYLAFTLLEDGTYSVTLKDNYRDYDYIVGYNEGGFPLLQTKYGESRSETRNKSIKIPATYENKTVTQIGDYAFNGSYVKSVEIPSTIKYIGAHAFGDMQELENVVLPDSIEVISQQAFDNFDPSGRMNYIVVPSSVKYIGSSAFSDIIKVYYKGTNEQFSEIKHVRWTYDGRIEYTEELATLREGQKLYFYAEDISDITAYLNTEQTVKGIWKYNDNQEIESVAIEYGNTVNGKTYEYTNSDVNITDEGWQIFVSTHEQGMLEMLLTPEEVEMFTSSSNKEEYAQKCETYNATVLSGMTITFADGLMTVWKDGAQYSYPLNYLEVNNAIYCKTGYNYTLVYILDNGKVVEDSSTEYGGAKHYYAEQAQ